MSIYLIIMLCSSALYFLLWCFSFVKYLIDKKKEWVVITELKTILMLILIVFAVLTIAMKV